MKVFLDVGAYRGETAEQAVQLDFYDQIYSFEPSLYNIAFIKKKPTLESSKFHVYDFGLWDKEGHTLLYHDGTTGGSVFEDKSYFKSEENDKRGDEIELCEFVKASSFLSTFRPGEDEIVMKLNCEGAECDIIADLIASGEIHKLCGLGVDFDCRKIVSLQGRRQETIIKLIQNKIPFIDFTAIEVPKRVQLLTRAFFEEYNEDFNATSPN